MSASAAHTQTRFTKSSQVLKRQYRLTYTALAGRPAKLVCLSAEQRAPALPNKQGDLREGLPVASLKKGKARLFWNGAPTVYRGAIDFVTSRAAVETGDPIMLIDTNGNSVGWGVYNATSLFCVRILQWASEVKSTPPSVAAVINERVKLAAALRKLIGLPRSDTNIYRLINSEGDRLSGLIVDVYGSHLVAVSSAAWIELNRSTVEAALRDATGYQSVTWRPAKDLLKLEGIDYSMQHKSKGTPGAEEEQIASTAPHYISAVENGMHFKVNLQYGQKTGFYADQRDSRALIRSLSAGKRVLDLCCYTGGFALNAAAGGASEVVGVDSSAAAISLAQENAQSLESSSQISFVNSAIEGFMRDAASEGRQWDIVILDPPKLAPNKGSLPRAKSKYVSLNAAAIRLVANGGLLMSCSCSGAVAQGEGLLPLIEEAARSCGRKLAVLRSAGTGMDHPLDPAYPEGTYLSNVLAMVALS